MSTNTRAQYIKLYVHFLTKLINFHWKLINSLDKEKAYDMRVVWAIYITVTN